MAKGKILLAEDEPDVRLILRKIFEKEGYEFTEASDGIQALQKAREEIPDVIVLDVMMPRMGGFEVLENLRENRLTKFIPVIMLTARAQVNDKIAGLRRGADDYVTKPFDFKELIARVEGVLERTRKQQATNPLTNLPGNLAIEDEIKKRIAKKEKMAICYFDYDNFKAFNDIYGFEKGDKVILLLVNLLLKTIQEKGNEKDFIGHIGGDDFILVTTIEAVDEICSEILKEFDRLIALQYDEEDRKKGCIEVISRTGKLEKFPLMTLSVGIVTNKSKEFSHYGEAIKAVTEMKKYAKNQKGSLFVKDRRVNGHGLPQK